MTEEYQELDFDKDMRIDETALDVEWLNQPRIAMQYCRNFAYLTKVVSRVEEKVKTKRSELINKVNENPVHYCNKPKPNAGDIEAYYRTHPDYKDLKEELINATYEKDMAENAKNEISFTRKKALEYLVILHGQQYFAGPKVPRDLIHEVKKWRGKGDNKIKSSPGMIRKSKINKKEN